MVLYKGGGIIDPYTTSYLLFCVMVSCFAGYIMTRSARRKAGRLAWSAIWGGGWSYEHKHEHEQESAKASSSASVIKDWTHNHKAPPHAPTRHHYALVHHYGRVHARQGVQVGAESSVKWIRARGYLQASAAHAFASALLGRTCVRRTNVRCNAHVQHHFKSRGHLGWSASPGATYGG